MIIIGLAGGKPCDRNEIADRIAQFGKSRVAKWAGSESAKEFPRVRDLSVALRDTFRRQREGALIIVNVMTQGEADEIRKNGGVIWHVMGRVSDAVRIERDDPKVTHMQGGCRHFLDALEAWSDELMKAR